MKTALLFLISLLPFFSMAQSTGDTLIIPTINYSQTFTPNGRDTMIQFPNDPGQTYEKIIMAYNMRCKDGNISVPGNTNIGCGEWDYKCNTYITDSSRVDSILSYQVSHTITHFSGDTFYHVDSPMHDYYEYLYQNVILNNIISETQATVGSGSLELDHVIQPDHRSGKSQFLVTNDELSQAGVIPGNLDGILLTAFGNSAIPFLRVKIKHTAESALDKTSPDHDGFTEVYFSELDFTSGENRIQFYAPFEWDGVSNIIVEFSFTGEDVANQLMIEGEDTGENYGLFTTDGTHIANDMGYTQIPAEPLSSISEEITVSLWCFGQPDFLPANTSIIHGLDENGNRSLNVHLPWSNSGIYFDCGYEGGYDRIDKTATLSEIEGQWNHWTFTKNVVSGEMKIYLNGELWHSGTGKTRLINIEDLVLGGAQNSANHYFGKIDEVRIWDAELDQETIHNWMNVSVDESHPNYTNLVAYYKFDEGTGTSCADGSPFGETAQMHDYVVWDTERGNLLSREFESTSLRPNITFLQGEYDMIISDEIVTVWEERTANVVTEYEIIPRYGTMLHDSINPVSTQYLWQAGYEYIYNHEGQIIDSSLRTATGYAAISELNYYRRYPAKYEIMSFVTPYGIYLDLGMEGKTWLFDVTDFAPILKSWKRLSIELGGQRQEDMDIQFWYILGTPPRDVLDINQIWRASSNDYTSLMNDRAFEPREFYFRPDGEAFKVRSVITGHGQQGEFTQRWHSLNINGDIPEFEWKVWTECSTVPIYPQGGTWIFDRAGWCPGDPSDLYEYDITEFVTPGQTHSIDYNLTYASGASNYQVSNQLVTYGAPNFGNDAAVINITKPNSENAAFERFNPACSYPVAVIKNTGENTLTSLTIEYFANNNQPLTFNWTGSLEFLQTEEVELSIPDYDFWAGDDNIFTVEISDPNGQADEYEYNNAYTIIFETVDLYDVSETYTIECKTNNQGYQTSYSLTDLNGNEILYMDDLENATLYSNDVNLELGCYQLRIDDTGDNGLYFWYQPNYGSGYFRIKDSNGTVLYAFEPEFGRFAIYEFGIVDFTGVDDLPAEPNIVTVYPNPATDFVFINFKGLENNLVDARIFDATMSQVFESQICVDGNDFTESISLQKFPAGVYFLELEYDGKKSLKKIVKK
jgi:hypothetical protein